MKDDWIAAALLDDSVVVEMLFRLKQSDAFVAPPPPPEMKTEKLLYLSLPPLRWGNRQRRSKPSSAVQKWSGNGAVVSTRRSPTTPLSWSGGSASPSDGGCDESSRPLSSSDLSSSFRSKCTVANENCNISSSSQRSKRKKTFTELEEENSLMKERVHLERELASVHVNLNQQRTRGENLKKIKTDLNLESVNSMGLRSLRQESVPSYQCNKSMESTKTHSVMTRHTIDDKPVPSDPCRNEKPANRGFILPDLNMEPTDDEIGSMWN